MFLHEYGEDEMPRYDVLSNLCKDHISLQPSKIPSTSHHGSDFAEDSKADLYDENDFCVVDPYHKKNGPICQILEEEKLVDYFICEPHHLSGSLKEDREKIMKAMNKFVGINALVTRRCWKASVGELEGDSFLEELIALKEGIVKMEDI